MVKFMVALMLLAVPMAVCAGDKMTVTPHGTYFTWDMGGGDKMITGPNGTSFQWDMGGGDKMITGPNGTSFQWDMGGDDRDDYEGDYD